METRKHEANVANLPLTALRFAPAAAFAGGTAERGARSSAAMPHEAPSWFKESFLEIAEDVDEASEANKHVLLFFQLNACPYCDRMLRSPSSAEPLKA